MAHEGDPDRRSGKIRRIEVLLGAALAGMSCLGGGTANARTSSATLGVSVTVQNACAVSASSRVFGASVAGAIRSVNDRVRCSSGVLGYTVSVSAGAGVARSGASSMEVRAGNLLGSVADGAMNQLAVAGAYGDVIIVTVIY